jgi:hypothetical protein
MTKRFLTTILIVGLLGSGLMITGCKNNDLLKSMVDLDRSFIPALAFTDGGDQRRSPLALEFLKPSWEEFKTRNNSLKNSDPLWQSDLERIDQLLAEADRAINQAQNLATGHEKLERMRLALQQLRKRHKLDYYIDHLYDFHHQMEVIVLTAERRIPQPLTADDLRTIRQTLPEVQRRWGKVMAAPLDGRLFQLNREQAKQIRYYIAAETESLDYLEAVLPTADRQTISEASLMIHTNYARVFMAFGDFTKLK